MYFVEDEKINFWMADSERVMSKKILRHRPPFLFINEAFIHNESQASAEVPASVIVASWACDRSLSVLPAEYAAQLMGILLRAHPEREPMSGVLAGIGTYMCDCRSEPLATVDVRRTGSRGAFHDFEAIFVGESSAVRGHMNGTIHLMPSSPTAGANVPAVRPSTRVTPLHETLAFEQDEDTVRMRIRTLPECPVYDGHFPDAPITPGVLIAEIMIKAAQQGREPLGLRCVTDLLFHAPLPPNQEAEVRLRRIEGDRYSGMVLAHGKRLARAKFELGDPVLDWVPSHNTPSQGVAI